MSNSERMKNLPQVLQQAEPTFTELARRHQVPDFTFARESAFAMQILKDNEYLAGVAFQNQDSLKEAIINVAALGLSLSPMHKLAYLVPRKKKVCLDISYQGLIHLATSKGVIKWAKAEIVHEKDKFEYLGVNKEPHHRFNPFEERGKVMGGYCVARMVDGECLVDFMTITEIYSIRDRSEAWKAFVDKKVKSTIWKTDEGEMIKKTLIRRAYKSWPKTVAQDEMDKAMEVTNESDGIDFRAEASLPQTEKPPALKDSPFTKIRTHLKTLDRDEKKYVSYLVRIFNRKLESLEDLTEQEAAQALVFLNGLVSAQLQRKEKPA